MTQFDDKEKAHETKYARDRELEFKVVARRNKLLGQWAAEKMHLPEGERDAYAKSVVMADFEKPGEEDVFDKVKADLNTAGLKLSDKDIREVMHRLMDVARQELMKQ